MFWDLPHTFRDNHQMANTNRGYRCRIRYHRTDGDGSLVRNISTNQDINSLPICGAKFMARKSQQLRPWTRKNDGNHSRHHSLDWFKGRSTGNHGFYQRFPVFCPVTQSNSCKSIPRVHPTMKYVELLNIAVILPMRPTRTGLALYGRSLQLWSN